MRIAAEHLGTDVGVDAPQGYPRDALARATGSLRIYLLEPSCSYVKYESAEGESLVAWSAGDGEGMCIDV